MKTYISFIFICIIGFIPSATANNLIPAPIFYQLSKRLLNETQHFVEVGDLKSSKLKVAKAKGASITLKCQPKKDQLVKSFGVVSGSPASLWKTEPDN